MKPSLLRFAPAFVALVLLASCTQGKSASTEANTIAATSTSQPLVTTEIGSQVTTATASPQNAMVTTTVPTDQVIRVSGRYVGRIDQDPTVSAAVVSDGFTIVAYFTNGKDISTWFRGPLLAGGVIVRKADGDTLRAIVEPQVVHGAVVLPDGREVTFSGVPAGDDKGLFRKAEFANGVSKIQGWIVQNDGATVSRSELSYASSLVPSPTLNAPLAKDVAPKSSPSTTGPAAAGASSTSTPARVSTTVKPIAATARPDAPILADTEKIDLAAKVDATAEDVAPPTPNGPLRFVISATGDSLASGEGAPDVSGKYEGPDFAACRTSSNAFAAYTPQELEALGAVTGLGSRLFIEPRPATAHVADARAALATYTAAKTDAEAARRALDTATSAISSSSTPETKAALAAARTKSRSADFALTAATAQLVAKVNLVSIDVEKVLPAAVRSDAAYTATATAGPLVTIEPLTGPQRSALRFAAFWTAYQPCVTQPMKRTTQEQWQSAFKQSKPESATSASAVDDDATRCHRSMNAPAALAAAQLGEDLPDVNVVYRSFACAGSDSTAIDETSFAGIQPPKGSPAAPLAPQADQLAAWARGNGFTTVDSFYLGMGAATSTFGVTPAVCALPFADIAGKDCKTTEAAAVEAATADLTKRIAAVQGKLGSLSPATTTGPNTAQAMLTQFQSGPPPVRLAAIHVPSIPDIASGADSQPCPGVGALGDQDRSLTDRLTTQESTQLSADVVPTLNAAVSAAVKEAKWELITGIAAAFKPHGFCATDPWIHTNRTANAQQAALIGKLPSSAGAPDRLETILPENASIRTTPAPGTDTDADVYQATQFGRNEVPIGGSQANTAMLLPNSKGYREGYLPHLLKAVRDDARRALTPAGPDQFRADPAPDGVTLRWRDRSVNELNYLVAAAKDTAEQCGTSSLAPLEADSQSVTLTVRAGTSCSYSVQACGASLAGAVLCSDPATATFTATPPPAPTNVLPVPGDGTAVVRWDPVKNATHYVVHLQLANGASLSSVTDLPFVTLPEGGGLLPGGQHVVLVRSCATSCGADGPAAKLDMNGPTLPPTSTSTSTTTSTTTTITTAMTTTPTTTTLSGQTARTATTRPATTVVAASPAVSSTTPPPASSSTAAPPSTSPVTSIAPATTRATVPTVSTTSTTTTAPATTTTTATTASTTTTTRPPTSTTVVTSVPGATTTTVKP